MSASCDRVPRGQGPTSDDRRQDALSLAQGQGEDATERPRGCDREVRVLQRPSTLADARRRPRGDRLRGEPQGDVASLDQRSIVRRPVLPTWSFVFSFGWTLDGTSRSCAFGRHDSQGTDARSPRGGIRAPTPGNGTNVNATLRGHVEA